MIHLRTINLEKIDEIKHCCLLMPLDRDDKVRAFISRNFMEWIQKQRSVSDEKIELGKSYVVEKDNRYVGVVGSLSLDRNGFLEVWYVVKNDSRGRGYGDAILSEITPYLIENIDGVNNIKLKIDKNNKPSIKLALKNGYYLYERGDDVDTYLYFEEKSTSMDSSEKLRKR